MMRIWIDARTFWEETTSTGKYVTRLIQTIGEMSSKGENDVTFVIFGEHSKKEEILGVSPNFEFVSVHIPKYSIREQFVFPWILKRAKLDKIHFPNFNAPIAYNGTRITTLQDLTLSFYPGKSSISWFKDWAYRLTLSFSVKKSERVIVLSPAMKHDIVELFGIDDEKIEIVPPGVDAIFSPNPPKRSNIIERLGAQGWYILYVGQHRENKNLGRLVRAFKDISDRGYEGMLLLAGKEDSRYNEAREAVRELGLKNRVIFPGTIDPSDMPSIYSNADLFILPSLYEGFWLAALEAMASWTPVALSKTSSLPHVGGDAAQYFHPLRVDEMVDTMEAILNSESTKTDMIKKWLEQAKKFDWNTSIRNTLRCYVPAERNINRSE